MTIALLYDKFLTSDGVITDTRQIRENTIFFALKGPSFNGNQFAEEAIAKGCSWAIVDEEVYASHPKCILVNDVLASLQELAQWHRRTLKIPVIALTGSNGKTTTKELVYAVLSQQFQVVATKGNLNNHIGVPLSLLSIKESHEMAIIEMGANHQKEIGFLCKIAEPDFGLITNIGQAHLEGFGGIEGVIKGKTEMYQHLDSHEKTIFYNADNPILVDHLPDNTKNYSYGNKASYYCTYKGIEGTETAKVSFESIEIHSHLLGEHQWENIGAAMCIGKYFGLDAQKIKKGIESYIPTNNRSELLKTDKNALILDAYNANPSSMIASLGHFMTSNHPHKYIILGDMFELGKYADEAHLKILNYLEDKACKAVFFVGKHFYQQRHHTADHFYFFEHTEQCAAFLQAKNITDASILIKGSRSMKLEQLTSYL